ncbi:hypothetical protein L218DRAFT_949796 [Marasmius fiardii PR-910]|nr:hypothetical protein L218DRAFT_951367 [Marasmius fiardii PR-910]KAF9255005.1 hypothetical protein L218DRAFT_951115 [Marasmius fiardii PR-910]KAF9256684.1 hypothetical protein L218DRAFT_949796 [Marasmius fiardii PR-910]
MSGGLAQQARMEDAVVEDAEGTVASRKRDEKTGLTLGEVLVSLLWSKDSSLMRWTTFPNNTMAYTRLTRELDESLDKRRLGDKGDDDSKDERRTEYMNGRMMDITRVTAQSGGLTGRILSYNVAMTLCYLSPPSPSPPSSQNVGLLKPAPSLARSKADENVGSITNLCLTTL